MEKTDPTPKLDTCEVAQLFGVSTKTIWSWATKGLRVRGRADPVKLSPTQKGRFRKYTPEAVEEFRRSIVAPYGRGAA